VNIRQMSVNDWLHLMRTTDTWYEQVQMVMVRQEANLSLATWERNCLIAYERLLERRQVA